jgi:hypothetical protein
MLRLERVVLGTSLKSYFPARKHESIEIACKIKNCIKQTFLHSAISLISKIGLLLWIGIRTFRIGIYKKARKLHDQLLQSSGARCFASRQSIP